MMGLLMLNGLGTTQDAKRGVMLMESAAENGSRVDSKFCNGGSPSASREIRERRLQRPAGRRNEEKRIITV